MTKTEIKSIIKEIVNKDPPLLYYLESNSIYGKYIAGVYNYIERNYSLDYFSERELRTILKNSITNSSNPMYMVRRSKKKANRTTMNDIFYNR